MNASLLFVRIQLQNSKNNTLALDSENKAATLWRQIELWIELQAYESCYVDIGKMLSRPANFAFPEAGFSLVGY